ncbi:hypothetical protein QWZ03_06600 [Chitinimonas viridis]|uniref:Barstar (barnase inhibitor) domain-containing protein n=1 Tax=Chitinimonas viridis TaxID=664880 RepID=A0ABT8B437_9NEIS|nr:hypothetical protein [Chitinimonas viridis]MDN3576431.1 hypothetical protein [Chitinimonas viridis]
MATFTQLDWTRPDVHAIVNSHGLLVIDATSAPDHRSWLSNHRYETLDLDFKQGISPVVEHLGHVLHWQNQFGYALQPDSRNLDALWDGFEFEVPVEGGLVCWLADFETAWVEDKRWAQGFMVIITDYCLQQLALGRRFYAILTVSGAESPILGQRVADIAVPHPYSM